MSGNAIQAWRENITRELSRQAQDAMPDKRRPDIRTLELVGVYLAQSFIDERGYVDETQLQIAEGLHGSLSVDQIGDALSAWQNLGVLVVIRKGAKGSGTRRVFSFHDPKNLAQRNGANPVTIGTQQNGVAHPTERGSDDTQRGTDETQRANPVTPEQLPEDNPNHYLPSKREQVADQIAEIALGLNQDRVGKINTATLRRTRLYEYKTAALAHLSGVSDLDLLDPWLVAVQLVDPSGVRQARVGETTPTNLCSFCEGATVFEIQDPTTFRTTYRKCVCIGGTYTGEELTQDPMTLEDRIENDRQLKHTTREITNRFTLPPA
jgi:hypothetical protein